MFNGGISRRDFLKLLGAGAVALAFGGWKEIFTIINRQQPSQYVYAETLSIPTIFDMDQSSQAALIGGTTPGSTVTMYVNGNSLFSLPAADNGHITKIRLPHRLTPGDKVYVIQHKGATSVRSKNIITVEHNYVTQDYDNIRSSWNPYETKLQLNNLNASTLGTSFQHELDGIVYAQPLYVQAVQIQGKGIHNIVLVATENNSVYAFDAGNANGSDAKPLWHWNISKYRELPIKTEDVCSNNELIKPTIGITATPVIDRQNNLIYFVATSKVIEANFDPRDCTSPMERNPLGIKHTLFAIDLTSGDDVKRVAIEAVDQGVQFQPNTQMGRPGLLLDNDILYLVFGSFADSPPNYYGWIMAYKATFRDDPSFLSQMGVKNTSPDQWGASIWMSGFGPAADDDGYIYLATADGLFDNKKARNGEQVRNYGDSILKLKYEPTHKIQIVDYFTPSNQEWMNATDTELGSGGVLVLPDQKQLSSQYPHLLVYCGKQGTIYLINRDAMGKYAERNQTLNISKLNFTATTTPSLANGSYTHEGAGLDAFLAMAWIDTATNSDYNIRIGTSMDGETFNKNVTKLNERSPYSPSLTFGLIAGKPLFFLAFTGNDNDNHINIVSSQDPTQFSSSNDRVVLNDASLFGPSIAFAKFNIQIEYLCLAWVDRNNVINFKYSKDVKSFSTQHTIKLGNAKSKNNAILRFIEGPDHIGRGELYLLWIDLNNKINIVEIVPVGSELTFDEPVTLQQTSDYIPTLERQDDLLCLIWTDKTSEYKIVSDISENGINGFGQTNKRIVHANSSSIGGPTSIKFCGYIYILWTDRVMRGSINIASLFMDKVIQRLPNAVQPLRPDKSTRSLAPFYAKPTYYRSQSGKQYIYFSGGYPAGETQSVPGPIKAFELQFEKGYPKLTVSAINHQINESYFKFNKGTVPAISSLGGKDDTAIIWALTRDIPTVDLRSFSAVDLTHNHGIGRGEGIGGWQAGSWTNSSQIIGAPTVINGKIYVATNKAIKVFEVKP
jgi:hypothetical protein